MALLACWLLSCFGEAFTPCCHLQLPTISNPLFPLLQGVCSVLQQSCSIHMQQVGLHCRQHRQLQRQISPSPPAAAAAAAAGDSSDLGPRAADSSSTERQPQQQQQSSKHGSSQPRPQKAVPIRIAATTNEETYSLEDTKVCAAGWEDSTSKFMQGSTATCSNACGGLLPMHLAFSGSGKAWPSCCPCCTSSNQPHHAAPAAASRTMLHKQ